MSNDIKASALEKIQTIDMFSKEGWKEVHKKCRHITPNDSDRELADGFIDFQIIWYDDNDLIYEDFNDEEREELENDLLHRYTDYLLHD